MNINDLSPELQDSLEEFHKVYVDGIRKAMDVPEDWKYFSDRATVANVQELFDLIGEGNIKYVSGHIRNGYHRFSIFVSPAGSKNVRNRFLSDLGLDLISNNS